MNIRAISWEIAHLVAGHRDACFADMLWNRLEKNFDMTPEQALEFTKQMYRDGILEWVNSNGEEPDWTDGGALVGLTRDGWKFAESTRPE